MSKRIHGGRADRDLADRIRPVYVGEMIWTTDAFC
jgi:hypothetical protein